MVTIVIAIELFLCKKGVKLNPTDTDSTSINRKKESLKDSQCKPPAD